ncbi:hypothetical protein HDU98_009537 [Podochytrium sp. JEL0797]|nr:hypothetical protein HDU98_009537 [Podochytrium sp. JEL0797]
MDSNEDEKETPFNAWTDTAACISAPSTSSSTPCRVLIVSCSKDAAKLLSSLPSENIVCASLLAAAVETERNSWAPTLGTGAGAVLIQLSPGVLAIDLSSVALQTSHLDLLTKLFAAIGTTPTDSVVVLDRKFAYAVAMEEDEEEEVQGVEAAVAVLTSRGVKRDVKGVERFRKFGPPSILTGWGAAVLTHCEIMDIPCHLFVAQDNNMSVFQETNVLGLFGVRTGSLEKKLEGIRLVNKEAGKPETSVNALFL